MVSQVKELIVTSFPIPANSIIIEVQVPHNGDYRGNLTQLDLHFIIRVI